MTRREFLKNSIACSVLAKSMVSVAAENDTNAGRGIRVRFLGSGASGWDPEWGKKNANMRRQSSILLENRVLIDFTLCSFDFLPAGCKIEAIFQTHSHGDHYNPDAVLKVGAKRLYVHETWVAAARADIAEAAARLQLPVPEVIALSFAKPVTEGGLTFTAVPANHSTSRVTDGVLERTCLYLVEKGPARLLYATDTGGIPGDAARMIGIDPHISLKNYAAQFKGNPFVAEPKPITAFIMEATNGDIDDDFRLFVHSSKQLVERTVAMLKKFKRYQPPEGQSAYLTHLAIKYRGWPSEKIEKELSPDLKAAYDGLELILG